MAQSEPPVGTISELKIWIAGQFDLVKERQDTSRDDMLTVRRTVHELANTVSALTVLDIPGKLEKFANEIKEQDDAIKALARDGLLNQSAISNVRAIYGTVGILLGAAGALIAKLIF